MNGVLLTWIWYFKSSWRCFNKSELSKKLVICSPLKFEKDFKNSKTIKTNIKIDFRRYSKFQKQEKIEVPKVNQESE